LESITISVPTVHCGSCKLNIEESLEELAGVESSEVDLDAKQVTVTFDPSQTEQETLISTIEQAGYEVNA
jgi:Cu2+-exporting ATPase